MASINRTVNSDGSVSYRVRIRIKGVKTLSETFRRKSDARRWAQETETEIRQGRYFHTDAAQKHNVRELIERYQERILPTKAVSTQMNQRSQLAWWDQRIGDMALASISPVIISDAVESLMSSGRSGATANRYMAVIQHCFNYAMNELEWMNTNPAMKVTKPTENRGRIRFLSDDERERLLTACRDSSNPLLYPAVLLAISTGMRKSEQFNLKWVHIDLHEGRAILHDTKNGERRAISINGPALDELRLMSKVRRIDNDYVFYGRISGHPIDIRRPFERALEAAGIENFRWHDLRHTFASYMAMDGATLPVLMDAMGHKTLDMIRRYAHLTEDHVSEQVASMIKKVFGGMA